MSPTRFVSFESRCLLFVWFVSTASQVMKIMKRRYPAWTSLFKACIALALWAMSGHQPREIKTDSRIGIRFNFLSPILLSWPLFPTVSSLNLPWPDDACQKELFGSVDQSCPLSGIWPSVVQELKHFVFLILWLTFSKNQKVCTIHIPPLSREYFIFHI